MLKPSLIYAYIYIDAYMFFKHIVFFSSRELIQGFSRELQRLERFARAACAKDRRYQEVLFPPKKHTDGDFFSFFFSFFCFFCVFFLVVFARD